MKWHCRNCGEPAEVKNIRQERPLCVMCTSAKDAKIERLKKQNTNLKSQVKLWKMRLEEAIKLYEMDGEV